MSANENERLFERVRVHAFRNLDFRKRETTNLILDEHVYKEGETIGPDFQRIVAFRPSVLVFADDQPGANFGHDCRYLLYDATTGDLHREVAAQFPPIKDARQPKTLRPFHEPVRLIENPDLFRPIWPVWRCPIIIPEGKRYAILFSGMSNRRHLNDLEFLYRTLIDCYYFDTKNIYALSYDGTLNTQDGMQVNWPGDGTAYRIKITGAGTHAAFDTAIDDLKGRLKSQDTLLIHTNNHGGYDGTPGTANLCTYPNWAGYYANDFASKLNQLPRFRQLIVMMEQCHSGGFNAPIIAKSTADATSIASAVKETDNSWGDANWDFFARDWIAAQAGNDPYGAALAFNADTDADGKIEAEEAYGYANAIHYSGDSPVYQENSEAGGDIALGQEYVIWWWWCRLLYQSLEQYRLKLPPPEYYRRLGRIQPELARLTTELDRTSEKLRAEYAEKVQAVIAPAFEKGVIRPKASRAPKRRSRSR